MASVRWALVAGVLASVALSPVAGVGSAGSGGSKASGQKVHVPAPPHPDSRLAPAGRPAPNRELRFPAPPHPKAIGTVVGAIESYVSSVTLSPPVRLQRLGLTYTEWRGMIRGVSWGGQMAMMLACHYTDELPFVLRIPPRWSGGLVTYRPGSGPLALWAGLEAEFGARSLGRIFNETADRQVSDVALHPSRR